MYIGYYTIHGNKDTGVIRAATDDNKKLLHKQKNYLSISRLSNGIFANYFRRIDVNHGGNIANMFA